MLICKKCGCKFENPQKYKERHGLETPPYEVFFCCPQCGGDYVHTELCIECGYYIEDDYVDTPSGWICDNCYIIKNVFEDHS